MKHSARRSFKKINRKKTVYNQIFTTLIRLQSISCIHKNPTVEVLNKVTKCVNFMKSYLEYK